MIVYLLCARHCSRSSDPEDKIAALTELTVQREEWSLDNLTNECKCQEVTRAKKINKSR